MSPHPLPTFGYQRGASLLVAMTFLIIMAMLGITAANVTTLQERMAGNTRDRDLALQAAEVALRDAEERLANDATFRDAAIAFDASRGNDDTFWETCFTSLTPPTPCTNIQTPTTALPSTGNGAIAAQPQYVLERKGVTQIYRVTARAVGGTVDAVVILQAEFSLTP